MQLRSENPVAEFGYNWAVEAIIKLALDEDIGRGDITTESTVQIGRASCRERV